MRLWPTPDAQAINDGEEPETFLDRREREKAKGQNGNGMGTPLAMAAKLWPTPEASDGTGGRVSSELGGQRGSGAKRAVTLGTATAFWASPTASDGTLAGLDPETNREGSPSLTGQAAIRTTRPQPSVESGGHGRTLAADAALWGTLRASDWKDDSPGSAPENGYLSRQVQAIEMPGTPSSPSGPTSPRRLNPAFVCWLMGWPEGWSDAGVSLAPTSFARWETASSRWLRALRSSCSPRGLG